MTLIKPPPFRLAAPPPPSLCIIPSLKPGTEEVASVCGAETGGELCCPQHWGKVSKGTRADFIAERKRLRELKIAKASPFMRELIKRVIIEAARR